MLSYQRARPQQYQAFFNLMVEESNDYLHATLALMQMDLEKFRRLFQTVGEVWGIYREEAAAGFYWVEGREAVMHLHGLILKPGFQRQGIGREVLEHLGSEYSDRTQVIELGVQRSNARAIGLYEKQGFQTVRTFDDLGFLIMQKRPVYNKAIEMA